MFGDLIMTTKNENQMPQTEQAVETGAKKAYQSPELTVHGRVNEITQFLTISNPH